LQERFAQLEVEMAHDRRLGRHDGERAPHRRRGSLSQDRHQGHYEVPAVVKDGGWPILTKTNYVEWAAIMKIRLQVRQMWEVIQYDDVDYDEDRWVLDALVAAVPPEMQFPLSQKETAKEAWDAIAAARIGSDHARQSTLQTLRKEWKNLAFKPGEDIDDIALRLNTLMQKLVQFDDGTYDEERAIEEQMACRVESLIDSSTMTIEEAIGCLKVVDADEPQPPSGPVTIGGRLHFAGKQWEVYRGDGEKGEPSSATGGHKRGKPCKVGKQAAGKPKPAPDDACRKLGHWAKEC
jgi:hypothetical protein